MGAELELPRASRTLELRLYGSEAMLETVRPGEVEWTGDNPFIYLKRAPAEDWSALALYFRIALSPYGCGQAMLLLESPYEQGAEAWRLCLTDNGPMTRYLIDGFVKYFALFRPCIQSLEALEIIDGASFSGGDSGQGDHAQSARHAARNLSLGMVWQGLQRPFMAAVPAAKTQTGRHEMFSVFRPSTAARIEMNGNVLLGTTVERDFFGGRAQSAALAFSETWVRAAAG